MAVVLAWGELLQEEAGRRAESLKAHERRPWGVACLLLAELESQALDARRRGPYWALGAFHQALEAVEVLQKLVEAALGALPRASGVHLRTLEVHFRDTCLSVLTFVM